MILALWTQTSVVGQEKVASPQRAGVSVPFVGCKSDGQVGPQEAPKGTSTSVPISLNAAKKLAYYSASGREDGVLAPRGWYCFRTDRSGGEWLYVSPQPIDSASIFSTNWSGLSGPIIEISHLYSGTSGRFGIAEIISRVFPAYKWFVISLEKAFPEAGLSFTFGPYAKDALTYKSKRLVEYKTPPQTDGLGTYSSLKKNDSPIEGVAIIVGEAPDLLLLFVRLPSELNGLTPVIVHQVEREAERGGRR